MPNRAFRFGLNLIPSGSRKQLQERFQQAEAYGYDVLTVSDYVTVDTMPPLARPGRTLPPLLALELAAEITSAPRLGTYALNAGIYPAALLIRDVLGFQQLSGGRFELGMGAGYLRADFEAVGIPWGRSTDRVARVSAMVEQLSSVECPPLLLGSATSWELLRLAAQRADIVSINGAESKTQFSRAKLLDSGQLAERFEFLREAAGDRYRTLELNMLVHAVHITDRADTAPPAFPNVEELSPEELFLLPGILSGSASSIAEDLHRYRELYGVSYFTIREPHMETFAKVIAELGRS